MTLFRLPALLAFIALASGSATAVAPAAPAATEDEALASLAALDFEKLFSDKAYAEAMLGPLETAADAGDDPRVSASVELLRAVALGTLGRHDEAVATARRAVLRSPGQGDLYAEAAFTAARASRPLVAASLIEAGAREVREPEQVENLRNGLDENFVHWLRRKLREAKAQPEQDRLSEALLSIHWPSPDRPGMVDTLRQSVIRARLPSDPAGAKALLAEMTDPAPLLPLLVSRRYDALFAGDSERLARLEAAIAAFDKGSAERLRRRPDDPDLVLDRAQFLRGVGRDEEAIALLSPWTRDLGRVEAGGEKVFWLVNEAAYALNTLGRSDEAVALMEKLIALDMSKHPYLISMAINHGDILIAAERYADGARYSEALFATGKAGASLYGQMWMWANAACSHAHAGRPEQAAPWVERLKTGSDDNPSAHLEGLLCTGDLDAAERLMLKQLGGEDVGDLLVDLQDYTLGGRGIDPLLATRMAAVRARPAVAAAIARRGHLLKLPLSRNYWTDY